MIEIAVCAALMRLKGIGGYWQARWMSTALFGALCLTAGFPFWQSVLAGIGWRAAIGPSIGEEIGAMGGIRGAWNRDDFDGWFGATLYRPLVRWVRWWGLVGLAVRGLFAGVCLALPLWSPWFLAAGAAMPMAYWIGVSIEQIRTRTVAADWRLGEWLWGGMIGAALAASA
jgi:hypothetical protein